VVCSADGRRVATSAGAREGNTKKMQMDGGNRGLGAASVLLPDMASNNLLELTKMAIAVAVG
jgi:hypothetical protein